MRCPKCQFENPKGINYCGECGAKLDKLCPGCHSPNPPNFKFCGECGGKLESSIEVSDTTKELGGSTSQSTGKIKSGEAALIVSERKHVTVLFSDLTGYTAISEKLDPEEVKEITSRIFGRIAKVIAKYDGFVEKYAGDAVMAIFGVPQAHEDDPVRAIKAAREIHQVVDGISPEVENRIGQAISMHSGINTGLVVTGEVNMEHGTHGVAGDTINLAARLSSQAKPGEILVNVDTCRQVEGHFECEFHEEATVKGKSEPVEIHKVLSEREAPVTIRRLSGVRADLVGRSVEMAELTDAVDKLKQGKGRIFSICGAAGTGKSRLVEEFKASLDLEDVQWIESHAYAYSQDIPYFPLVDFLNRLLQIDEKDPPSKVKEKVESGLKSLIGDRDDIIPYVGGLYSLSYPQTEEVSPEFWKMRLQDAILTILSNVAEQRTTVFFIEDLHWADPSFVELLRRACVENKTPALLLCAYRPTFSLFTGHQLNSIGENYLEIRLENLSLSVAQHMLESLLKTESIPTDLKRWVNNKAEGNPFYLEELINSLVESETLTADNGNWKLTRSLTESDIPSSLHGLINGRLDRLEKQTKRILQEASVIGRDFLYEILKRITELEERIDGELYQLERLDLIRARTLQPEIEYMFKHALTQEVVYSSLLKKERRGIHEQIALVIEAVFKDRLSEFNETLAYHFARGQSTAKAVEYLVKSGEKCLARYAVEEAHEYFQQAYEILQSKEIFSKADDIILIDLLNSWGYSFYYLGEFKNLIDFFKTHLDKAESLEDMAKIGMFYGWLGIAHFMAGLPNDSYGYLRNGLNLGEKADNKKVVGYACAWLTWTCFEIGKFSEGIGYGERAQKLNDLFPTDQYIFFKSLSGMCAIYAYQGDLSKLFEGSDRLLKYGELYANSRSKVFGHWLGAFGYMFAGDIQSAQKSSERAIEVALDPVYAQFPKYTLGASYFLSGRLQEAESVLQSAINFYEDRGEGVLKMACQIFLSSTLIAKGKMQQGKKLMEETQKILAKNNRQLLLAISEYIIGEVNAQIATGPKPAFSIMAKNVGFLLRNKPFAAKKAVEHFCHAIEAFKKFNMKGYLGLAYLGLGKLYKSTKKVDLAHNYLSDAIGIFQECKAEGFLKQAKETLAELPTVSA